jgi:hypothetical protein
MSITYPVFQKVSFYLEIYDDRQTFLLDVGQRSRAIIPGDDPGDQQPPERRGFYRDPDAVAANGLHPQLSARIGNERDGHKKVSDVSRMD